MSNIQKLFSGTIEIFSAVACTNISILMSLYSSIDNSLMSNIQKLFSEKIEIFSAVEFSKVSVLTGIIKISLKVCIWLISTEGSQDLVYMVKPV